jgi:hypothetical protein
VKAVITAGETVIELSESASETGPRFIVSGRISPQLKAAVESTVEAADAAYDSPAYGTRIGWAASSVADSLGGEFVIEDEPPEEDGVVY